MQYSSTAFIPTHSDPAFIKHQLVPDRFRKLCTLCIIRLHKLNKLFLCPVDSWMSRQLISNGDRFVANEPQQPMMQRKLHMKLLGDDDSDNDDDDKRRRLLIDDDGVDDDNGDDKRRKVSAR